MKILYFLLVILVILPFVNADPLSFDIAKNAYMPGETFQAEILFNVDLEDGLSVSDFEVLKDGNEIEVAYSLIELNSSYYYLYFDIPNDLDEGNYTLVIKNLVYVEEGVLLEENYERSLEIFNKQGKVLAVSSGVIVVENVWDENIFDFEVRNNGNETVNVDISSSSFIKLSNQELTIDSGETENFQIFVDAWNDEIKGHVVIGYGGFYDILIWLPYFEEEEESIEQVDIAFLNIDEINQTLDLEEERSGPLKIKNTGSVTLQNLVFGVSDDLQQVLRIKLENVDSIGPGEVVDQYVWINERDVNPGFYFGYLTISNDQISKSLPVSIKLLSKGIGDDNETVVVDDDLNGTTDYNYSEDDFVVEEENSRVWIWFLFIFVLLLILLFGFVFYRKKKRKPVWPIS